MDTNRKDTARYDDLLKWERPEFGKIIRETAERENRDENPASVGEDTE